MRNLQGNYKQPSTKYKNGRKNGTSNLINLNQFLLTLPTDATNTFQLQLTIRRYRMLTQLNILA